MPGQTILNRPIYIIRKDYQPGHSEQINKELIEIEPLVLKALLLTINYKPMHSETQKLTVKEKIGFASLDWAGE